ncbi:MAG TPA: hypothetical protein VK279_05060 [Solirubrobacteraceae bacterium]|nr:hypothetical protein [Solirubrobacteraceae bacterium]
MSYTTAFFQWEDGLRALRDASPQDRRVMDRVHDRLVEELRRRLGGSFTTAELAELYDRGTDWAYDLAVAIAPDASAAWQPQVADAAFGTYVRGARDYAGGRRLVED